MATTADTMKNFFDTMMDTQKQVFDNMKSNAEKFSAPVQQEAKQTWENQQEFFKTWYEKQMGLFNNMTHNQGNWNAANASGQYQDLFNQWMNTQQDLFKNFLETYQKMAGNGMTQMKDFSSMNGMSQDWNQLYTQWTEAMQNSFRNMQGMMSQNVGKDAFSGMLGNMDQFHRFSEMWSPIFKAMQENVFQPSMFNQLFKQDVWKNYMSQMFNLSPEWMKNINSQWNDGQKNWMNQTMDLMAQGMKNANDTFSGMNQFKVPAMFDQMLNAYKDVYGMMEKAAAPMALLVNPSPAKDMAEASARIQHLMVTFQVRNAQMMYHIQETGQKVNEEMMNNWMEKMKEGNFPKSMMDAYTEWLSLSDKLFVKLFESDEYSKLQAELSSTGMKLKKEMDLQIEKSMAHIPVITRSEMDDFYKTVYDLKKRVRDLEREKEAAIEVKVTEEKPAEPTATRSTRKTK